MTAEVNPSAAFDALFVVSRAGRATDGLYTSEVQVFAYLACLLSLFDRRPASAWGYGFVAVPPLQPYSPDLDTALQTLSSRELVQPVAGGWLTSETGHAELTFWESLSTFAPRVRWLQPASAATALHSVAAIADRLAREPSLALASKLDSTRDLLEDSSLGALYEQFAALRDVLGSAADELLIPADVYLRYLAGQRLVAGDQDPQPVAEGS